MCIYLYIYIYKTDIIYAILWFSLSVQCTRFVKQCVTGVLIYGCVSFAVGHFKLTIACWNVRILIMCGMIQICLYILIGLHLIVFAWM